MEETKSITDVLKETYDTNPSFRAYVDAYCVETDSKKDEALTHSIVRNVYDLLYNKEDM